MPGKTEIQWTDFSWNPVTGCTKVSAGCDNCYASTFAERFRGVPGHPYEQGFDLKLWPARLDMPVRWTKPRKIFVNSMSDLFHADIPTEFIDAVFGAMAAAPRHVYQVLTKRPQRMARYANDPETPRRVETMKHVALAGRLPERFADEREVPLANWPGYSVSNKGRVFSDRRTAHRELEPESGEKGHARVTLYRDGESVRQLVHRLVLEAFDRPAKDGEQGCHINGDSSVNALWNLRWGSQVDNWDDSKRHGTRRRYFKLTEPDVIAIKARLATGESAYAVAKDYPVSDTQIRNIGRGDQWTPQPTPEWPLSSVWLGTSVENQEAAFRIDSLVKTPAAVRFLSCEPLLGPLNLDKWLWNNDPCTPGLDDGCPDSPTYWLDWIITGGESGTGHRPCNPDWVRSIRDQCLDGHVAFFHKQWGGHTPKAGGRLLDGIEWNEMPAPPSP